MTNRHPLELTTATINIAGSGFLTLGSEVRFNPAAMSSITKTGQGTVHVATPLDLSGQQLRVSEGTFNISETLTRGDVVVDSGATLLAAQVALNNLTIAGSAESPR